MTSTKISKSEEEMTSRIIGIQFGILSPEEIRKNSVVEVTSRDTYNNDKPIIGGLFDPRMGTLEPGYICPTDGLNYIHTPGYFGHIELARPVYFIQHLKEIIEISRCICYKCSHLLMDKKANQHLLKYPPAKRWKHVSAKCKNIKRCGTDNLDGCGTKQPTRLKQEGMATLIAIWESIENKDEKVTVHLTPDEVLQKFRRISDEDVEFMGFSPLWSRPDWMICTVLPVPPPAMRPSVKHDAQQRREDDLTHIYSNIIKINNELKHKIQENSPANVIEQHTTILQYYVAMIVDNKAKGSLPLQQRSGRPLQCIMSRINSKTGRIRGNLMGKRVNFSARSVITGDPNLSIREIGVPLRIAKNLTKPEIVNERNRSFLMRLVENGPDNYPGAKTLERAQGGNLIALRNVERGSIQLYDGDIVHRHLMDGDALLFNRQPSLHRMSMMAHIVRVMHVGDTFRFNVACTKPYNADFDGDEMNTHIPQNILAETELRNIANIPNQIISPAKNSPIIGIFQDSLLGSYRLTRSGVDFSAKEIMNLLMRFPYVRLDKLNAIFYDNVSNNNSNNAPGRTRGRPGRMTNFQLLSQILPPLSLRNKTKLYGDSENEATSNHVLEIRNGEYIRGQLEGSMLAGTSKGLIHRIFNDFSPMQASQFIDSLQSIVTEYMKQSCFSVGINDLLADANTMKKIREVIEKQKFKVQDLINQVQLGVFENNTSLSNMDEFESRVRNLLNECTGETGKISRDSLNPLNRFIMIITSGSKGSPLNLSYMISGIGQQNVEGKRVPYGFDGRTLPHYSKYDDSPNARGFIENSYVSGLTAEEVFFHAMAGRIGLIDTAVKSVTWETSIILIENGKPLYTEIGRWIDTHLSDKPESIQHFQERRMELLEIPDGTVFIPTTDEFGVVTWGAVTAMTRHDPGTELYEIQTKGGRKVTVTESKSLLIWDSDKQGFYEKATPDIRVGDFVPVTAELCEPPIIMDKIPGTEIVLDEDMGYFLGSCFGKLAFPDYKIQNEEFLQGWLQDFQVIPPELYLASSDFIMAFIANYYFYSSYFRYESNNAIIAPNATLINGLSMLLNRIGIYGDLYITDNLCSLHFEEDFEEILQNGFYRSMKTNRCKDVFLDPIVEIQVIGVEKHPKVYDLTIPSTLNFGLANGLQVRDTSQTGYIQRRLIKGLEDLKVEYDMTVRNNKGKIVQFQYGDDGFEPTRVENQSLKLVEMSIQDIYTHFECIDVSNNTAKTIYTPEALQRMKKQSEPVKKRLQIRIEEMISTRDRIVHGVFKDNFENTVHLPVAFQYTINNIQGQLEQNKKQQTDLTPLECLQMLDETFEKIQSLGYIPVTKLFETMYYFFLNPRELLEQKRFQRNGLVILLETIYLKYKQAIVHPGEMVGIIAGQSIGEPTTQLTLNTFHQAGSAKANATQGVPRIEEILRLTKNPKNPSITVYLKDSDRFNKEKALHYSKIIKHMKLIDVVDRVEILFEKSDIHTIFPPDQEFLNQFFEFEKILSESAELAQDKMYAFTRNRSKWVLRLEINSAIMLDNNLTMNDIHYAIRTNPIGQQTVQCLYSDFNADRLVFRLLLDNDILFKKKQQKALDTSDDIQLLRSFQETLLNNVVLRGVKGIRNVLPRELLGQSVFEDGQFKKKNVWVLDTTGTNLLDTLALDFIDQTKTFSSDIAEIHDVLGIEATRQSIYNEIREVMSGGGETYINYHHLSLLADRMTSNKNLVPIFRSGILSDDVGPIMKATFEVQTDVFLQAARHAELDNMRGVSANVMTGQTGFYGTHAFQLLLDFDKMKKLNSKSSVEITKTKPNSKTEQQEKWKELYREGRHCLDWTGMNHPIQDVHNVGILPGICTDMDYDMGF